MTAVNQAQIDTAQSKFGGASGLFDGTGDYLSSADSADWAFGSGDFTIDFWLRFATVTAQAAFLSQMDAGGDDRSFQFNYNSDGGGINLL